MSTAITTALLAANAQEALRRQQIKRITTRRNKEGFVMNNEIVREFIGKQCSITVSGAYGGVGTNATIIDAKENWILVDDGKKLKTINLDYVTTIEQVPVKEKKIKGRTP